MKERRKEEKEKREGREGMNIYDQIEVRLSGRAELPCLYKALGSIPPLQTIEIKSI